MTTTKSSKSQSGPTSGPHIQLPLSPQAVEVRISSIDRRSLAAILLLSSVNYYQLGQPVEHNSVTKKNVKGFSDVTQYFTRTPCRPSRMKST
jgi:hypothetical protein